MNLRLRYLYAPIPRWLPDGALLLQFSAAMLTLAGVIAFALGVSGEFLPHDERYLAMTARELCSLHGCRIVHFMIHDRISFGGALVAVGLLYWRLTDEPLRRGQAWAWWLLLVSGVIGFASFFAYLSYGYLDTWHGLATLALLPCFALGLIRSWPTIQPDRIGCLLRPGCRIPWTSLGGIGRAFLLATAVGSFFGGLTIEETAEVLQISDSTVKREWRMAKAWLKAQL